MNYTPPFTITILKEEGKVERVGSLEEGPWDLKESER